MSIINNSLSLGSSTRDLVLKTRGTVYIKVGDRYHKLNFGESSTTTEETVSKEEPTENKDEQFVYVIENKSYINYIDYPGDNKLIVGKNDKTFFITLDGIYVDVTPKGNDSSQSTTVVVPSEDGDLESFIIDTLGSVVVTGCLSGQYGSEIDFESNTINFENINISGKATFPKNTVFTNCCVSKSSSTSYINYDFIKLDHELESMKVKSGVIVRSNVDKDILVYIGNKSQTVGFESEKSYIIFLNGETVTYSEI
jgi:hypothetical protein